MNFIPFNVPAITNTSFNFIDEILASKKFCGGGPFTHKSSEYLQRAYSASNVILTTSCTDALEMIANLIDIHPGDEIVVPSYTFVSSANPFVMRGAKIKFVDVDFPSLNITAKLVEGALNSKTKAVVAVNYGGGSCDIAEIRGLCEGHNVLLIEDAAQSYMAQFEGRPLGSFGHLSALSFHETKNIHCGEGGALILNDSSYSERAEVLAEKGTNRSKFIRGEVDKYTWVDNGSSHIMSEINAGFLYDQLLCAPLITDRRLQVWNLYAAECLMWGISFLRFPPAVKSNGHIFAIFTKSWADQQKAIHAFREDGIQATFHYVPLHNSPMGRISGSFFGEDTVTSDISNRIIRLPLYDSLNNSSIDRVLQCIRKNLNLFSKI